MTYLVPVTLLLFAISPFINLPCPASLHNFIPILLLATCRTKATTAEEEAADTLLSTTATIKVTTNKTTRSLHLKATAKIRTTHLIKVTIPHLLAVMARLQTTQAATRLPYVPRLLQQGPKTNCTSTGELSTASAA